MFHHFSPFPGDDFFTLAAFRFNASTLPAWGLLANGVFSMPVIPAFRITKMLLVALHETRKDEQISSAEITFNKRFAGFLHRSLPLITGAA